MLLGKHSNQYLAKLQFSKFLILLYIFWHSKILIFFFRGIEAQSSNIAAQPVGFAAAVKAAEERIQTVLKNPKISAPLPVVAIENFILEVGEDKCVKCSKII